MKIALSVGHSILKSGLITSADGLINEYKYCKDIAPKIKQYLEQLGHEVALIICPEKKFVGSIEEKKYKLDIINKGNFDLVVELHLNAFNQENANGTEVYYYSSNGKVVADRVQKKLAARFKDRGVQKRTNLYILNSTKPPAILLELFYCTNKKDVETGKDMDTIAKLIAEGVAGKNLPINPTKTITPRSSKADIKWLQEKLNKALPKTDNLTPLKVNGVYNAKVRLAVLFYWNLKGWGLHMKDDGIKVGKSTREALAKL